MIDYREIIRLKSADYSNTSVASSTQAAVGVRFPKSGSGLRNTTFPGLYQVP